MKVTLRVENSYMVGHSCTRTIEMDAPDDEAGNTDTEFWADTVWYETGCHCGEDVLPYEDRVHSTYVCTIIAAEDPAVIGTTYDWGD